MIPLDPGPRPLHARRATRPCGARSDAGSSWQRLDRGLPQRDAHVGVLREGMAIDSLDVPGLYFGTSTGQVFASADEGESWSEIASYLPAISSVEVAVLDVAMAEVHLPATLPPLFRDLPRRLEVDAATVDEAIDRLDERWPGLRDRLCEPGPALRPHINVYVDRERAGARHGARRALARRRDRRDQRRLGPTRPVPRAGSARRPPVGRRSQARAWARSPAARPRRPSRRSEARRGRS